MFWRSSTTLLLLKCTGLSRLQMNYFLWWMYALEANCFSICPNLKGLRKTLPGFTCAKCCLGLSICTKMTLSSETWNLKISWLTWTAILGLLILVWLKLFHRNVNLIHGVALLNTWAQKCWAARMSGMTEALTYIVWEYFCMKCWLACLHFTMRTIM